MLLHLLDGGLGPTGVAQLPAGPQEVLEDEIGERQVLGLHLPVEVEGLARMIRASGHRMDQLAIGDVCRVQPTHPEVVQEVQGAFRLGIPGASLDHHREEHLVRLDQLPGARRMELLPGALQLPFAY